MVGSESSVVKNSRNVKEIEELLEELFTKNPFEFAKFFFSLQIFCTKMLKTAIKRHSSLKKKQKKTESTA